MTTVTDEYMKEMIATAKNYTVVILKSGPEYGRENAMPVIWEHARRNFALRADGRLSIVCPVSDSTDVKGIGIFNATEQETKQIMDGDPGVMEKIFIYETHAVRSFPGDSLPG